jgi:hypothetical protein
VRLDATSLRRNAETNLRFAAKLITTNYRRLLGERSATRTKVAKEVLQAQWLHFMHREIPRLS